MSDRTGWRPRCLVPAVAVLALLVLAGPAHAGLSLEFGRANYDVEPGAGIDVAVFLTESGTDILATDGLNSAGLLVSFNLAPMVSDPAQVTMITPNPGVNEVDDFLTTSFVPATATEVGTAELMFSVVLSDVLRPPAGSSSVLLGNVHFMTGSAPGQVTRLSASILPGGPQFLSGAGQELDSLITSGTTTITVQDPQVVPEPGSLTLAATGAVVLLGYAWRQRKEPGITT